MSDIRFTPTQPGAVRCKARNQLGSDNATGYVKLGDLERPFMISGLGDEQKIAIGDYIKLECGAIIYNYTNVVWRKDGEPIEQFNDHVVEDANTKFSWRKTITWKQITKDDEGVYECEAEPKIGDVGEPEKLQVVVSVHEAEAPIITSNFNQSTMQQTMGESLKLDCLVSGLPVPSLVWYKNDETFNVDETANDDKSLQRIMIDNANSSITFSVLRLEDAGTYKCVAWNRVGTDQKSVLLEIPSESSQ